MSGRNERGKSVTEEFGSFIFRGKQKGYFGIHRVGRNPDFNTDFEDIWCVGGIYEWNIAAEQMILISDDEEDMYDIGSGARQLKIMGIDSDFNFIEEVVNMNGSSGVTTINEFLRVNEMEVYNQGIYGKTSASSAGTILASGASLGQLHCGIITDMGKLGISQLGRYTLAKNYFGIIHNITIDIVANKAADIILYVRENAMKVTPPFGGTIAKATYEGMEGFSVHPLNTPIFINAMSGADIWFAASGSGNNTKAVITFDLICYPVTA